MQVTSYRALGVFLIALATRFSVAAAEVQNPNFRKPANDEDLRHWLQDMVWYHRFTTDEIGAATGLSPDEVGAALKEFDISPATRPKRAPNAPLLLLPYPGGRHPRIGFLD